jgi:DNA-binding HxlR family transcriptional regulator
MRYIENPFDCPVTRTMNLIGGKWKPIILNIIGMGEIRFGKLNQLIPAISNKVLANELQELEKLELVIRSVYKEIPPRVEYKLTKKGESLIPLLNQMAEWGKSNTARALENTSK